MNLHNRSKGVSMTNSSDPNSSNPNSSDWGIKTVLHPVTDRDGNVLGLQQD